jgi:hypothetical protein
MRVVPALDEIEDVVQRYGNAGPSGDRHGYDHDSLLTVFDSFATALVDRRTASDRRRGAGRRDRESPRKAYGALEADDNVTTELIPAYVLRRRRSTAAPPIAIRIATTSSSPERETVGAGAIGSGEQMPRLPGPGFAHDWPGGQDGSAQHTSLTQLPDEQSAGSEQPAPFD